MMMMNVTALVVIIKANCVITDALPFLSKQIIVCATNKAHNQYERLVYVHSIASGANTVLQGTNLQGAKKKKRAQLGPPPPQKKKKNVDVNTCLGQKFGERKMPKMYNFSLYFIKLPFWQKYSHICCI